jgi:adenosylcobyric acid synthase
MFLGTGSDVGKSVLAAAFCRILKRQGYRVAPFKAQNMALNSFITPAGGEMGRAQVVQAEAAGIEPHVDMNPVLLKPTSHMGSPVIVLGKAVGNFSAMDYYRYKKDLLPIVQAAYERLAQNYDIMVLEGAGSAVELNLKEHDLVNMRMAQLADARCILVGDIDRGGIFAALLGSFMLLEPQEQQRIIGFMVNKLRGDPELFRNGVHILEARAERPVLGVIPHFDHIALPEEDSVALGRRMQRGSGSSPDGKAAIGVVRLPFISNYTDFDPFEQESDVQLTYFDQPRQVFEFDALILPGSKNTLEDLDFLKHTGLADAIIAFYKSGGTVVGICGGYQMLGLMVRDPFEVESRLKELPGLGLLHMETEMFPEKITSQIEALPVIGSLMQPTGGCAPEDLDSHPGGCERDQPMVGYEIHMGRSIATGDCRPLFRIRRRDGREVEALDGLITLDGRVWGTYIHGIFDNDHFRRSFLRQLQMRMGKSAVGASNNFSYGSWKNQQYDLLADHVEQHSNLAGIYKALELS